MHGGRQRRRPAVPTSGAPSSNSATTRRGARGRSPCSATAADPRLAAPGCARHPCCCARRPAAERSGRWPTCRATGTTPWTTPACVPLQPCVPGVARRNRAHQEGTAPARRCCSVSPSGCAPGRSRRVAEQSGQPRGSGTLVDRDAGTLGTDQRFRYSGRPRRRNSRDSPEVQVLWLTETPEDQAPRRIARS